LGFWVDAAFEQNVCKLLKIPEAVRFAQEKNEFSTDFSTKAVENFIWPEGWQQTPGYE
jgi:hypothetical protein